MQGSLTVWSQPGPCRKFPARQGYIGRPYFKQWKIKHPRIYISVPQGQIPGRDTQVNVAKREVTTSEPQDKSHRIHSNTKHWGPCGLNLCIPAEPQVLGWRTTALPVTMTHRDFLEGSPRRCTIPRQSADCYNMNWTLDQKKPFRLDNVLGYGIFTQTLSKLSTPIYFNVIIIIHILWDRLSTWHPDIFHVDQAGLKLKWRPYLCLLSVGLEMCGPKPGSVRTFLYMSVFLHGCVCIPYVQCPQRPEEGIRFPGTEVRDCYESPYKCWELNVGPQALNCWASSPDALPFSMQGLT